MVLFFIPFKVNVFSPKSIRTVQFSTARHPKAYPKTAHAIEYAHIVCISRENDDSEPE